MTKRQTAKAPTDKSCKQISDLLLDYVNNRLKAPAKRSFDAHLKICPDCVGFLNTYRKTISATQTVPVESMPEKIRDNMLAFLRRRVGKLKAWIFLLATSLGV